MIKSWYILNLGIVPNLFVQFQHFAVVTEKSDNLIDILHFQGHGTKEHLEWESGWGYKRKRGLVGSKKEGGLHRQGFAEYLCSSIRSWLHSSVDNKWRCLPFLKHRWWKKIWKIADFPVCSRMKPPKASTPKSWRKHCMQWSRMYTCIFSEEENKMLNLVLDPSWQKKLETFDLSCFCGMQAYISQSNSSGCICELCHPCSGNCNETWLWTCELVMLRLNFIWLVYLRIIIEPLFSRSS